MGTSPLIRCSQNGAKSQTATPLRYKASKGFLFGSRPDRKKLAMLIFHCANLATVNR
jgi:hypothetical protein